MWLNSGVGTLMVWLCVVIDDVSDGDCDEEEVEKEESDNDLFDDE